MKNFFHIKFRKPSIVSAARQKGFTLVELMVSLSLFTVVVLASTGAVFVINNAAHQVDAMRSVLDNLNFALDSMTRTIHTADAIGCASTKGANCPLNSGNTIGASGMVVDSTIGQAAGVKQTIYYTLENHQIMKTVGGQKVAITAKEISIDELAFFVSGASPLSGAGPTDTDEPKATIVIKGVATAGKETAPFSLQTLVSVRKIE